MTSLRPSYGEREAFRSALSQAYADGRIDDDEFEKRATIIESCTSVADLRRALRELPQPSVVFPKTVTKAEALKGRRHVGVGRRSGLKRRVALGLIAVAIGFAAAGGIGRVIDVLPGGGAVAESIQKSQDTDYLRDSVAIDEALDLVRDRGYTDFVGIGFYDNHLSIDARSPKNAKGIDHVTIFDTDDVKFDPAGQFTQEHVVFSRGEVDAALLVEMAATAPDIIGGAAPSHLLLGQDSGELTASVYVEGDEYGTGSGSVIWTADGTEMVRISRSDG